MTDHTPAEMREQATELRDMAEAWDDGLEAEMVRDEVSNALRRLADVIEYVEARDEVANYTVNDRLLRIARGETNERKGR